MILQAAKRISHVCRIAQAALYFIFLPFPFAPARKQDADQKHDTHRKGDPGKSGRTDGLQHADQEVPGQADGCDNVAAVCLTGYFLIGVLQAIGASALSWIALPVSIVLLICVLLAIRARTGKEEI